MGSQDGTPSWDANSGRQVGTPSWDAKLGREVGTLPRTHIQSHTITKNHKHSQTFTTFIHKHTQYSQQITIHHTKWDAIIQTHKTSQYSQKITGGSQKITPIYIYIYILIPIEKKIPFIHKPIQSPT